jgi:dipeptide/tripeptide permease
MSRFADFWTQVRQGFSRTFWVANILELFERFAFYGSKAVLVFYIGTQMGLGPEKATWYVQSFYATLIFFLPAFTGTVVDKFGFKKALLICFAVFSLGYFLIGLGGLPLGKPLVDGLGPSNYILIALLVTAVGGSLIKPCIVGTVSRTTNVDTKALGYSIYYTLVNLGGAIGPVLAGVVRQNSTAAHVLVVSAATSFLLFLATLIFFKEPPRPPELPPVKTIGQVGRDFLTVVTNGRFISFLVIFSGFWAMFWQIFGSFVYYTRDVLKFESFELIESVDAWTIILVTAPAGALARKLPAFSAMILGFALATASWFLMGSIPTLAATVVAIAVFAVGEAIQAPRFYEYVADLAPKDQVGTYMGFAFLPVAIGSFVAGPVGGKLITYYIQGPGSAAPARMWYWVGAIGVVSTLLMLGYDRLVVRRARS